MWFRNSLSFVSYIKLTKSYFWFIYIYYKCCFNIFDLVFFFFMIVISFNPLFVPLEIKLFSTFVQIVFKYVSVVLSWKINMESVCSESNLYLMICISIFLSLVVLIIPICFRIKCQLFLGSLSYMSPFLRQFLTFYLIALFLSHFS